MKRWTDQTSNRNRTFPADTSVTWRVRALMLTSLRILLMIDVLFCGTSTHWTTLHFNRYTPRTTPVEYIVMCTRDIQRIRCDVYTLHTTHTLRCVHVTYNENIAMYTRGIQRIRCDVYTRHTPNTMSCSPSTTTCNNTGQLYLRILLLRHDFQHIMLLDTRTIQ